MNKEVMSTKLIRDELVVYYETGLFTHRQRHSSFEAVLTWCVPVKCTSM